MEVKEISPEATEIHHPPKTRQNLLAIFLPSAKPPGNFGIGKAVIAYINRLLQQTDVVLYLFGNPYFLNLLDAANAKAVVVAYQDFGEFQDMAARHFEGRGLIKGKLPVTLKAFEE